MDPLTHAVSGAALGAAKGARRREIALLALLAMAPDADIVFRVVSDLFYLQHHRGITHSLLMLPLWTWLIARILRPHAPGLSAFWIAAAIALHILLDLITSFGTMIFAPVSRARVAWDWVFIVDPLFTVPMLLALVLGAATRRLRAGGLAALAWLFGYLALAAGLHAKAIAIAAQEARALGARPAAALPLPFSPARWRLVLDAGDKWLVAAVDLAPAFGGSAVLFPKAFVRRFTPPGLAPAARLHWRALAKPDWQRLPELPLVRFYRWFARFAVVLHQDARRVEIGDVRFGAGDAGAMVPFRLVIARSPSPQGCLLWHTEKRRCL